ncbi:MAG: hypothetical protein MZV65_22300 [Chromatiales bacterium]|nr:hypothetical protein [Chromatiales bacterium]
MIRRYRPALIWSTYPIATAHWVGSLLQRLSGLPWIADFRDPMVADGYPTDPRTWRSFKRIEERNRLERARLSVFTTPGAMRDYAARYPQAAERLAVIENGYDEGAFTDLRSGPSPLNPWRDHHAPQRRGLIPVNATQVASSRPCASCSISTP